MHHQLPLLSRARTCSDSWLEEHGLVTNAQKEGGKEELARFKSNPEQNTTHAADGISFEKGATWKRKQRSKDDF